MVPSAKDNSSSEQPGVLVDFQLQQLIKTGAIEGMRPIDPHQVQPNSIDLRLGEIVYRTRCSFLPVGQPVDAMLKALATNHVPLDNQGFVLDCNQTYIIPLMERLNLPKGLCALTNPKSSTGRLDILARVLTDNGHSFDVVPDGYSGILYLELITRSFPVRIHPGDTLAQLRVFRGRENPVPDRELRKLIDRQKIIRDPGGVPLRSTDLEISDGVVLSLDLGGPGDRTIGYRSKSCTPVIDLRERSHVVRHFWEYIYSPSRRSDLLILEPHAFYIFASRERIVIPPDLCAEMVAIDVRSGEVRMHYAGFFDSGFGLNVGGTGPDGAHVVLEVRNMDVPFYVQDGQKLFRLRFFRNSAIPSQLYGSGSIASNYQGQGLRLAKQFAQEQAEQVQLEIPWVPAVAPQGRKGRKGPQYA